MVLAYACGFIYLLREHGNKYPKRTAKRAVLAFVGVLVAGCLLLLGTVADCFK